MLIEINNCSGSCSKGTEKLGKLHKKIKKIIIKCAKHDLTLSPSSPSPTVAIKANRGTSQYIFGCGGWEIQIGNKIARL